ncbi:uncharacterized protein LOC116204030 [Punica granatum]|uniref:Uncharacterized protein LOC116204030 n=1 Tax=Punica granatum TaxID=22663 RepID=A0A6P8DJX8_PUNGR|nr:uncharacterized protein LOC116204030 [Punica granatum]
MVQWDEECQGAFKTIKMHLTSPPVLIPPTPRRPLFLYLAVIETSLRSLLGQEDKDTHRERAIFYLIKKFTKGESRYPEVERFCCALLWVVQRLYQYTLYYTIRLISKVDPLRYLMDKPSSIINLTK